MSLWIKVGPHAVTISQGSTFMVTDPAGEIDRRSAHGVFVRDTRFLSLYRLYVNGEKWQLLNGSAVSYHAARFHFTNPAVESESGTIAGGQIGLTLTRSVRDGIHEDLDITHYGLEPVRFTLDIALRSDFADLFEVKAQAIVRRGQRFTRWDEAGHELVTRYVNEDFERSFAFRIERAGSPPRYANGRVIFDVALRPGEAWHACALYRFGTRERWREPLAECGMVDTGGAALDELQTAWLSSATRFVSDADEVNRVFHRSVVDMAALRLRDETLEPQLWVPAAGVPWFVALFGRDSLLVSLQTMLVHAPFALGALRVLARYQATDTDDWRDAEPGKILHEMRSGELAHFQRVPNPYYGTADATLLYLITLHEAWKWLGDAGLLKEYRETALRCLEWIDRFGDLDGDGFQEYRARSAKGYENMAWKDAGDAVVYPDGSQVAPPKALCELQGYAFDAKLRMAEVFEALGDAERAATLRRQAAELRQRFDDAYWMEREGFLAFGLDGAKRQVASISSNAGHCLWSGIVKPERAGRIVARLFQSDMWTGWGIRTLSADNPAYNPFSYQLGSVWPHDNGIIALGLRRYGFDEAASAVARAIFDAATHFEHYRLPELYAGLPRGPASFPVQYLGANIPQAWAAGSVFHLVRAMLGLEPDAPAGRLSVSPRLPAWLPRLELSNLAVGGSVLHLRFWREPSGESRWELVDRRGSVDVVERPPAPPEL